MDDKENKPFIFKTIGTQGNLKYRGLDQMADILQIAYDLFQDPYLVDDLGDPFIDSLETNPNEHKTFNRTVIERTIVDCHNFSKVKFDGRHISVCSEGIENSLSELEMVWFVAHDLKQAEQGSTEIEHQVPKIVKLTSMGKLAGILKYFLHTTYSLISDIRTKQLKLKLASTPERDRKEFLLRYRTDLKIEKHESQPIVEELLRVINLELDFIQQMETNNQKYIEPRAPAMVVTSTFLPVDIETDLAYELSVKDFPWKSVIIEKDQFKKALTKEFGMLPAKPKLHWYFSQFISDEEWKEDRLSSKPMTSTHTNDVIAATFVMPSAIEIKANEIIRDFNDMVLNNSVDPKYFGRMLEETDLVRALNKLKNQLIQFKGYVFTAADINTYADYGNAAAQSMLTTLSKLDDELGLLLLRELAEMDITTDITFFSKFYNKTDEQRGEVLHRFNILNVFAVQVFNEAIATLGNRNVLTTQKVTKPRLTSVFKSKDKAAQCIEMLKKVSPAVIGIENDYLLGERKKSTIVLWFDLLSKNGFVYSSIPPAQKAEMLNEMFPGLFISERSTNSITLAAEKAYGEQFEQLILKI